MKRWTKAIASALDGRDLLLWIGLVLIAGGLWPINQSAAAIAPGAVLVFVAIYGVRS